MKPRPDRIFNAHPVHVKRHWKTLVLCLYGATESVLIFYYITGNELYLSVYNDFILAGKVNIKLPHLPNFSDATNPSYVFSCIIIN